MNASALTMGVFSFVGMAPTAEVAIAHVTEQVQSFLTAHAWRDNSGRSVYTVQTLLHKEYDGYIYVMTLIGPTERTPDAK